MQQSQLQQQQQQSKHIGGLYGSAAGHNSSNSHTSNGHALGGGLLLHHDDHLADPTTSSLALPTVAASSTASLVSSSRTHHKQQTTQQVTTVTKVVREVQHHHLAAAGAGDPGLQQHVQQHPHPVDYVAMPLDMQHLGPDGQPVDYVAMPLGMYPRSQYINYSHMDPAAQAAAGMAQQQQLYMQGGQGGSVTGDPQYGVHHHGGGGHPHYAEYEHFPSAGQYANAGAVGQPTYMTGGGGQGGPATYLGDYGLMAANDHRGGSMVGAGSPSPSDDHSGSQSPQHQMQQGLHPSQQPVAYNMQTAYDDMVGDYRITPSPGGVAVDPSGAGGPVPNSYQDDPSGMVYGYVSTSPYGTAGGMPQLNPTYGTRPVVYDDQLLLNGGVGVGQPQRVIFDNEEELQKHMAALALHGHGSGHMAPGGAGGKCAWLISSCSIFI